MSVLFFSFMYAHHSTAHTQTNWSSLIEHTFKCKIVVVLIDSDISIPCCEASEVMGKDSKSKDSGSKGKGKQAAGGKEDGASKGKGKAGKADGLGTCTYVKGIFFLSSPKGHLVL